MVHVSCAAAPQRQGHAAVYALLEQAYGRMCAGPMPPVSNTASGKPFFLRSPVQFSLSHTKGLAACAISDELVGIDAELIRDVRPGVPERTMNPEELDWMKAQKDPSKAFLVLWTMKEAWVKLTGQGLGGAPQKIVLQWHDGVPLIQGEQAFFETREINGVMVTVCSRRREAAEWFWWQNGFSVI